MPYTPSNAAIDITSKISALLTIAGIPNTTSTVDSAKALVDGWLISAFAAKAVTINPGSMSIPPASGLDLTVADYLFTADCPRALVVVAGISGYVNAPGILNFKLSYTSISAGLTILANFNFAMNQINTHTAIPMAQVIIPAAKIDYPLAPGLLRWTVTTGPGVTFFIDGNDVVSYSIK